MIWKCWLPAGMARTLSPKPTSVSRNVLQSRLTSSWSVMTTRWAGAVAERSFSNSMRYGNTVPTATKAAGPNPTGPVLALGSRDTASGPSGQVVFFESHRGAGGTGGGGGGG